MKEKWYFTFGLGHLLRRFYVVVEGTHAEAREKMFGQFGNVWSHQYAEPPDPKYGLREIDTTIRR